MTSQEIKQLRLDYGKANGNPKISQEEFAVKVIGISARQYHRWENDESKPNRLAIKELKRIKKELDEYKK